jgi:2-C-methyl-D-erythritol 4-phosphate cytidylyltransferase/2-C-methyl-D-erythritol 2,4-cyclodiphosphate synthase
MKALAVLLAAGRSERFGQDKLWTQLDGTPLWTRPYRTLRGAVGPVGIVCPEDRIPDFSSLAPDAAFVVAGGRTRTESARRGFEAREPSIEAVLFHDAARPFVSNEVVARVLAAVDAQGAAIAAVPVVDTVKEVGTDGLRTLERERLVAAQTPQGAHVALWQKAFANGLEATDDAALLEAVGIAVALVPGERENVKVTTLSDLGPRMSETRTGLGYDVHPFSTDPSRPLWLGGVQFEGPGLEGHSDADVVLHAVVDALLGAVGLGDIGEHYANTDPRWKDAPSSLFLKESVGKLAQAGWHVVNIDVSVIAERPRLAGKREDVRRAIATLAGLPVERVSLKATTNEGLGAIGRGEGVAAFAVATVKQTV